MQYREPLPPDCPPASAYDIVEPIVLYQMLETTIPQPEDFDSFVKRTGRIIGGSRRTPCEQHGVSLCVTLEVAQAMLAGSLNRKLRWQSIGELTLATGAGKLNPPELDGHQTWWPAQAFDPVGNCKVIL